MLIKIRDKNTHYYVKLKSRLVHKLKRKQHSLRNSMWLVLKIHNIKTLHCINKWIYYHLNYLCQHIISISRFLRWETNPPTQVKLYHRTVPVVEINPLRRDTRPLLHPNLHILPSQGYPRYPFVDQPVLRE